jgi:uncharacterized protein
MLSRQVARKLGKTPGRCCEISRATAHCPISVLTSEYRHISAVDRAGYRHDADIEQQASFLVDSMRRVIVRRSPVHGKGVFALRPLAAGERVFEYKGTRTPWREAVRRHQREGVDGHTFLFGLSDGRVIDGSRGGNSARWLNHACVANCEAVEIGDRVFIDAVTDIAAGEELFIEYRLTIDEPVDEETRRQYTCRCGRVGCRTSMLADVR